MKPSKIEFSRTQDRQKQHSLEDSIRDYRKVYPELTDQQLANRYQMRFGISAKRVLSTMASMNQPTGGGVA
jgi:uncharacterized membrane protein YccC